MTTKMRWPPLNHYALPRLFWSGRISLEQQSNSDMDGDAGGFAPEWYPELLPMELRVMSFVYVAQEANSGNKLDRVVD